MPNKKQSLLLGGLIAGLLSTSYLGLINMICCLGIIIGAIIAVWHYTEENELTIPPGEGATMGVFVALIGFAISLVLNLILMMLDIRHDLVIAQFMMDLFANSMPPEAYEEAMAQINKPFTIGSYFADNMVNIVAGLVGSMVFGAIGGAIGAAVFKKGGEIESF